MREYVDAAARSLSTPAEMIAMPMLALAGALIGNRLHLVLKNSWREFPTLYVPIVAPPGTAKSPALNHAKWPLDVLQDRAQRAAKAEQQRLLDEWEGLSPSERGPKPAAPEMRHYFSTDLTIEALVCMLGSAPGVAIIRDEIGGWVAAMDQYRGGKGSDRQQYLSLWSGQTIKADRKASSAIYARHPVCCVVGGIQPDLAGDLHHAAQKRDGFVERLLPIVPEVGIAPWTDDTPSNDQYREVLALFERLDSRLAVLVSADSWRDDDLAIAGAGITVQLSRGAKTAFINWHDENARLIAAAVGLASGFYSKLPAQLSRLALILHALSRPDDPRPMLSGDTMADAIELAEFCRVHIGRFLALLQSATPSGTAALHLRIMRIVRKMRMANADDDGDEAWVSRSEIYRGLRTISPTDLDQALSELVETQVLERRTVASATKSGVEYRIQAAPQAKAPDPATSPKGDNANIANNANEETIARIIAGLQGLSPEEMQQYRDELDAAPPDDPNIATDREGLARFDALMDDPLASSA